MIIPKKTYHFSIDDVFDSLIEVSDQQTALFKHPFFRFCKNLHDKCGTTIDLYLFYQKTIDNRMRTLKEVSSSLKKTLKKNKWLRFGPHALDAETAPHSQTPAEQKRVFDAIYKEIRRFSGNLSSWVRLHYFSESYELARYFKKNGVLALFSTDKDAVSWRMPDEIKLKLEAKGHATYKGIEFIGSHFRSENFASEKATREEIASRIEAVLQAHHVVTIFTHEHEVPRRDVRDATLVALRYLKNEGISSI